MNNPVISNYLDELKAIFYSGYATEVSYRGIIEQLIEQLLPNVDAINEPKRVEVGAPDFVLTGRQSDSNQPGSIRSVPLGFIEAKDLKVGILDRPENQIQVQRYMDLGNIIHTDGLTWRFYFERELVKELSLGHLDDRGQIIITTSSSDVIDDFEYFLRQTISRAGRTIRTAKMLALHMADRARPIRHTIQHALQADIDANHTTDLSAQYQAFKETLIHDLTVQDFADLYAETIAYGLFAARYNDDTPETFNLVEAAQKVPQTNPFLRQFFLQIAAYEKDIRLDWVLNNFADLFSYADVRKIMSSYGKDTGMNHDPVTHFYETFLGEYDQKRRKARGVYYTPRPVVEYIVQAVDCVLREEFSLPDGLADDSTIRQTFDVAPYKKGRGTGSKTYTSEERDIPKVQILDPATGTSTFLNETIKLIANRKTEHLGSTWNDYVEKNLLPRLHGFEILMAAYSMAHMRLGLTLAETGYIPSIHAPRIGVYLTNALEAPAESEPPLLSMLGMGRILTEEAIEADKVKRDLPIMVVMGNPPYQVKSKNNGKYIKHLIANYKEGLNERKINLDDDYIKFIRYAENMVEKSGQGIVAMVTNNSYLDGITHRQMRKHLLQTFDKIHVLDLHGSSKKSETTPDGGRDENVFDIVQGVSVVIMIKRGQSHDNTLGDVTFAELYGKRQFKYESLSSTIQGVPIQPTAPNYYFVHKNIDGQAEYMKGVAVNELFIKATSGVQTNRDTVVIDFDKNVLIERIKKIADLTVPNAAIEQEIRLKDTREKTVDEMRRLLQGIDIESFVKKISYRIFDDREIFYSDILVLWTRISEMKHYLNGDNIGLVVCRQTKTDWHHAFLTNNLVESSFISNKTSEYGYSCPLFLYHPDGTRTPNFDKTQLNSLFINMPHYQLEDLKDGKISPSTPDSISPENVLDYIYAVLHSPSYRQKYHVFLKIDFPRIPPPKDANEFWNKAGHGKHLRQLHLMQIATPGKYPFRGEGGNIVAKLRFVSDDEQDDTKGNVYINDSQYFADVPRTVYDFYIGGYQPAQKWLKDRKDRVLGYQDIEHYQRVIATLAETERIMKRID